MLRGIFLALAVVLLLSSCGGGSAVSPQDSVQPQISTPRSVTDTPLPADEIVYMSDFKYNQENHLYSVHLNEDTGQAELTDLGAFPDNSAHLPAKYQSPAGYYSFNAQIGTTADGTRVYCFDYWSGMMVYYDADESSPDYGTIVDTGNLIHTGSTVLNVGEVTFGAPTDDWPNWGELYVATTAQNNILRVDPLTGAATNLGTIAYDLGGNISVSAGDLAFDVDGNFYLETMGSPGRGIYQIFGWDTGDPLTGTLVRSLAGNAQYRGLAITDGGAGDWLSDNDTGQAVPPNFDYIMRFKTDNTDVPYPMYLGGSPFNHGAGGDMSVGRLGPACPPVTTDLIAGQNIDVGTVTVQPVNGQLVITYEITDPDWCITETHLDVETSLEAIPQKNGNPIPGKFAYSGTHDCVSEVVYTLDPPEGADWCDANFLYIAAHAVVRTCDPVDYDEYGNPIYGWETAWGDGEDFPGKNWATYIQWEVCCN